MTKETLVDNTGLELLAVGLAPVAWLVRRHAPAVWTLSVTFLVWANLHFFPLWEKIQNADPWWLFPAALAMTGRVLVMGFLMDKTARKTKRDPTRPGWTRADILMLSVAVLLLFSVTDVTMLIRLRAGWNLQYPISCTLAVVAIMVPSLGRSAFACLASFILLVVNSVSQMGYLAFEYAPVTPTFLTNTLLGTALTVFFERFFRPLAKENSASASVALLALMTLLLLFLVHSAPWTAGQYETLGVGGVAVALFVLGIIQHSSLYRRFGLGVFVFALVRLYLIDLAQLETFYKILAFMALGAVLIVVSFLYSLFRERFQKWV